MKAAISYIYNPSNHNCLTRNIANAKSTEEKLSLQRLLDHEGSCKDTFELEGCVYKTCACNLIPEGFDLIKILAENYERGNLPYNKSILEQPGDLIELLEFFIQEREFRRIKEQENNGKPKN